MMCRGALLLYCVLTEVCILVGCGVMCPEDLGTDGRLMGRSFFGIGTVGEKEKGGIPPSTFKTQIFGFWVVPVES